MEKILSSFDWFKLKFKYIIPHYNFWNTSLLSRIRKYQEYVSIYHVFERSSVRL